MGRSWGAYDQNALCEITKKNILVKGVVGKFCGIFLDSRNVHESFDCPQSLLETLGSA